MNYDWNRIAVFGAAGAGKDEAIKPLLEVGYARHAFGDVIKQALDPMIRQRLGFSAFTEDRAQKAQIRRSLEYVGDDMYESFLAEFMSTLPERCANPRIVRIREAKLWREMGHPIIEILRPNVEPCSVFERDTMAEMQNSGLLTHLVVNNSSVAALHAQIRALVGS